MDWLIIATTGLLLACVAGWSVVGRIPTAATGRGVILRPRHLMQVQTTAAGQIVALKVRTGDYVREGELIATTDQSMIEKRIAENRRNLAALEEQDRRRTAAAQRQTELQAKQDTTERAGLEAQRTGLEKSRAEALRVRPILEKHAESNRKLVQAKLLGFAAQEVADAETAVRDNETSIQDYTSRLGQIDRQLRQIETRDANAGPPVPGRIGGAAKRDGPDPAEHRDGRIPDPGGRPRPQPVFGTCGGSDGGSRPGASGGRTVADAGDGAGGGCRAGEHLLF
jgi:HlyD family secretion protein